MAGINEGSGSYLYCSNCTGGTQSVSVSLVDLTGCVVTMDGYNGDEYVYQTTAQGRIVLGNAIDCDLVVNLNQNVIANFNSIGGGWSYDNDYPYTITIPAGQTQTALLSFSCYSYIEQAQFTDEQIITVSLLEQQSLPACVQNQNCDLLITDTIITQPSFNGSSDGSIEVIITGQTGASYTFRLNGGTPQSSNIFSGLSIGTYQVRVEEDECYSQVTIQLTAASFSTSDFNVIPPKRIVASENPITMVLATAPFDSTDVPSISQFNVQSLIDDGFRIRFNLNNPIAYDKSFYAKDFPNRDNYFLSKEVRDKQGNFLYNNTINNISISIAEAIEKDIIISQNYYVNNSGSTITLIAKENSSRYDLSSANVEIYNPAGSLVTTGITITQLQAGTDRYEGSLLTNYNIYTEVYVDFNGEYSDTTLNETSFRRLTEVTLPYKKDNLVLFDTSTILKNLVYTNKPDFELTGYTINTSYIRPFLLKYGEKFPLVQNQNTLRKRDKSKTLINYVCNAALDWEVANDMSFYTGQTYFGTTYNVPFLTNSPNVKKSNKSSRELLNILIPKNIGTDMKLFGNIDFWDGTSLLNQELLTIIPTATTVNFGGLFTVNISFDKLGLDIIEQNNNKLIKRVALVLRNFNASNNYSLVKSLRYDLEEPQNRLGVAFLNKLGTFDTYEFIGIEEQLVNRSTKTYTVPRKILPDGSSPEGFKSLATYDTQVTKRLRVNSGWIDQQHYDWLIEMVSSNDIYSYSTDYDNYLNVENFTYTKNSNDNLYNLEITFIQTLFENNITI
jgi:hypothetical protein